MQLEHTCLIIVSYYSTTMLFHVFRSMDRVNEEIINFDLIEDLLMFLLDTDKNDKILPPDCEKASLGGSILIFLPGIGEIRNLHDRLRGNVYFSDSKRFDLIPMHSTLSPKEQKRAFIKPKSGCQKIIIATNIAETSITIDDCVCGQYRIYLRFFQHFYA